MLSTGICSRSIRSRRVMLWVGSHNSGHRRFGLDEAKMSIDFAGVRAGVEAGLRENESTNKLSSRSGESSNGFGFVIRASLFNPERHFLSCFWPYHCRSVIPAEFRPSAGNVLQRPRPGNPSRESRIKLNAVMVENLPRHRRRQRAGTKADGLAPRNRGRNFSMVPEYQDKPLAFTKKQIEREKLNKEYEEYLQSEDWREKRLQRLQIAQHRCSACRNSKAIHVHHLTYARIFKEEMADLLPLCEFHHNAAERLIAKGKLSRTGDVLFLTSETLRLVISLQPHKQNSVIPKPLRQKIKIGEAAIEFRNEVQRNLLHNQQFIAVLKLNYDRRTIKLWLHDYCSGESNSVRSQTINNGFILWERYRRWNKRNRRRRAFPD